MVWIVGAYVALIKEDKERALQYLKKLERSSFSKDEDIHLVFAEAIKYLEEREAEDSFNTINDKAFIAKLSFKLMIHGVERSGIFYKVFEGMGGQELKAFNDRLEGESNTMMSLFTKEELIKKGDNVLKQAKGLME